MTHLRHLPNSLSILRMTFAVPVAYFLWANQVGTALWLLVIAGVTDLADGFLAREFQWRTKLGTWLDPAADKLLIATCLVTLTWKGDLPLWFCLLTMTRDVLLVLGVTILTVRGTEIRIQPHLTGKFATVAQNIALLFSILQHLSPTIESILSYTLIGSAFLTIVSSVAYGRMLGRLLRKEKEGALHQELSP